MSKSLIPASVRPDIRRRALIIFQAVVAVLHILRKSQLAAIGRQLGVQVNAVTCGCSQHEHQQVQRHAIPAHLPLADNDAAPVLQIPRQLLFFARAVTLVIAVPFEERQRIAVAVAEHAPQTGICGADGQLVLRPHRGRTARRSTCRALCPSNAAAPARTRTSAAS